MRYWTYAEIKEKVENDLGIEQEEFVTPTELLGYCNEAIDEAEAEIHSIYEDYFLSKADIDIVAGQEDYDLPSDIYANKIRGIMFKRNDLIYPLKRIRFNDQFADIMATKEYDPSGPYRYILTNASATTGVQLQMVPIPRDDISGGLKVWYLRNANRITTSTDVCDIPEFVNFVIQFMKLRVYEKEGHPNIQVASALLDQQRRQMVNTLTAMIIDGDTEIEKDTSFYEDMSFGGYYN